MKSGRVGEVGVWQRKWVDIKWQFFDIIYMCLYWIKHFLNIGSFLLKILVVNFVNRFLLKTIWLKIEWINLLRQVATLSGRGRGAIKCVTLRYLEGRGVQIDAILRYVTHVWPLTKCRFWEDFATARDLLKGHPLISCGVRRARGFNNDFPWPHCKVFNN